MNIHEHDHLIAGIAASVLTIPFIVYVLLPVMRYFHPLLALFKFW